jgi:ribosomal 30S subunit maturation factor RimM
MSENIDYILIGKIVNTHGIKTYPQCDYLEIKKNDGEMKLVPFLKEFVLDVDIQNKKVTIIEMEGLL